MTDTDLHDRLAKVLERLVEVPRVLHSHGGSEEAYRRDVARDWADRCLTDANAAIALIENHGTGDDWRVEYLADEPPDARFVVSLTKKVDDGIWVIVSEQCGPTQPEAICRAFVAWREQEVTA